MYERSPDYFKQFRSSIFYFTSAQIPESVKTNNSFAYGFHNESCKDFCVSPDTEHYHIMIELNPQCAKSFPVPILPVPCVYSTFKFLIATASKRVFQGEVFSKLQTAVLYNAKSPEKTALSVLRKRLPQNPVPCKTAAKESRSLVVQKTFRSIAVQTENLHTFTLERLQRLLAGPMCAELLLIMDILESGYGKLETNSTNACVNFSVTTNN